jgi:hypothetical protein
VECSEGPRGVFYRAERGHQRGGRSNGGDEWLLRPLRLGLTGIKGGVMGGVMARWHPRRRAGSTVEKMKPTSGAHVSAGG